MLNPMLPDRKAFKKDPSGYSRSTWMRWCLVSAPFGGPDASKSPTSEDLKSPLLWLGQAHALTQAAIVLMENEPTFDQMPKPIRGMCDTQYCAAALMLIGLSLEVCLKAMILMLNGVEAYSEAERDYKHHELKKLANFIGDLDEKDKAILELLTHFVYWAGRYPDPGEKVINKHDEIFDLSEEHQITLPDVTKLAAKVMANVAKLVDAPAPA